MVGTLAGAVAAYGQGQLVWSDGQNGYEIAILAPNPASPSVEQTGNSSYDTPAGTATYGGGWIGGTSTAPGNGVGATTTENGIDYTASGNFTVGLYMAGTAGGLTTAITSGAPVGTGTVESGGSAGLYSAGNGGSAVDPNDASSAWVGIAAWYNAGGTITSYEAAVAAGDPAGYVESTSAVPIGAAPSPAGNLQGGYGLTSFSLATVPEPSTIALGVVGACSLLLRRRKS